MICGIAGRCLPTGMNSSHLPPCTGRVQSLLIMVILGGMGLFRPVLGTVLFLLLEEYLPEWMDALLFPGAGEHGWGFWAPC